MQFKDIFALYFTGFRGQDIIPDETDPEWAIALRLANTAIMTWDRADGTLWQELLTTAEAEGALITLASGTSQYDGPDDMRVPATAVRIGSRLVPTVGGNNALNLSPSASAAYWTGGANTGWQLNVNGYNSSFDGQTIDFTYYKKPTFMTTAKSVPEMSDPNYMVQKMIALRSSNERNGFVYQTADRDATTALQSMILSNAEMMDNNFLNDSLPGFGHSNNGAGSIFR